MLRMLLNPDGSAVPEGDLPSYVVGIRVAGKVILHPLEALYLVLNDNAILVADGERITDFRKALEAILKRVIRKCKEEGNGCYLANSFWSMFTTYYNLRKRGRKVLPEGRREGTLIEIRKNKWWAEYLVLEEGVKIPMRSLLNWIDDARANDLKSIVAIVDRNGSVTYYEMNRVEIRANDKSSGEGQPPRAASLQKGTAQ